MRLVAGGLTVTDQRPRIGDMADNAGDVSERKAFTVQIEITSAELDYTRQLLATGLYGVTLAETLERVLADSFGTMLKIKKLQRSLEKMAPDQERAAL